jgi:hypothetical protein
VGCWCLAFLRDFGLDKTDLEMMLDRVVAERVSWMQTVCADIEDRLGATMNIRRARTIAASVAVAR